MVLPVWCPTATAVASYHLRGANLQGWQAWVDGQLFRRRNGVVSPRASATLDSTGEGSWSFHWLVSLYSGTRWINRFIDLLISKRNLQDQQSVFCCLFGGGRKGPSGYANEPSGGVAGFIIKTQTNKGADLMTLMKAPPATHPLDVIRCPQFLEIPMGPEDGMRSCTILAQGSQNLCHKEFPALWS